MTYDAVLVVSFGGPEKPEDVMPFLERVVRGRNVPRDRLLEVAEHYSHFGGKSPINAQNRMLVRELEEELRQNGLALRVYWGNRNWHPLLEDAVRQMKADGVTRALAFVTSAFSSYSGCRQYLEDIARARGAISGAPWVEKLRVFFNHPDFIAAVAERAAEALAQIPAEARASVPLIYTAHSIPVAMAENSSYVAQLQEACRLVSEALGGHSGQLVYQSRSGSPHTPWLGPDILESLHDLKAQGASEAVVVPIGFVSDHVEVLYDLDIEARACAEGLGVRLVRAKTPGAHPRFLHMIRELIVERLKPGHERRALGSMGPAPDECAEDCCPPR